MASTIAAVTTSGGGVVTTADASGNLNLLAGTTTVVALTTAGAAVTGTLSATGLISGSLDQVTGFKNRIINGAMPLSQRTAINTNVAVGTSTSGTFGPDRFSGYTGTASLWNILQVTTGVYDYPYALRLQRIAAQTSTSIVYLRQVIETNNCIDLAGQSVTMSFYATAGANYSGGAVTVQLLTGTAADQGTAALNAGTWTGIAAPVNTTFTPTATRTRFTFTGTVGANVQEIAFGINWAGSGTAGALDYLDVTGAQIEKSATATSFDYRPYGTELALCQRYFCKTFPISVAPAQNTGYAGVFGVVAVNAVAATALFYTWQFPVNMRGNPTIVTFSPSAANSNWYAPAGPDGATTAGVTGTSTACVVIYNTGATIQANQAYYIQATAAVEL